MGDIVKELRESRGYDMSIGEVRRAADEIERLRICIRYSVPAGVALDGAPTFAELIESEHRNPQTSETAVIAEELTKQADEIERLRAIIRSEQTAPPFAVEDDQTTEFAVELASAKQEIERLRAELAVAEKDHRAMELLRSGLVVSVRLYWKQYRARGVYGICDASSSDPADAIFQAAEGGEGA
jgi:hypothetical protein